MENNEKKGIEFHILLDRLFDGRANQEDITRIEELVRKDLKLQEYYFRCVELKSGLHQLKVYDGAPGVEEDSYYDNALAELAKYEQKAPSIEIPRQAVEQPLIWKVVYPAKDKPKLSKFNIFTLAMSAAAMLFAVLLLKFAPERPDRLEIATLVDQVNTIWSRSAITPENGSRLRTNEIPLQLERGIVKIRYDNDVDVLIEGPAKFAIERTGLFLEYGRLYSYVSSAGLGFTLNTPTSQFIDHGTEFGLQVDVNGSSELHVFQGKVQIFAGQNAGPKIGRMVRENEAVRYLASEDRIQSVSVIQTAFVRQVDSGSGIIWRGQTQFCLADTIGGGDGFGTGKNHFEIDLQTGNIGPLTKNATHNQKRYVPVPASSFIDGVFVPDGSSGPLQVSSQGHCYRECPATRGHYTGNISNGGYSEGGSSEGNLFYWVLNGKDYGTPASPAIYLHSNKAVTFDLQAIRDSLGLLQIERFTASCGVSESALMAERFNHPMPKASLFVLVDGQECFRRDDMEIQDGATQVDIPLEPSARFLTLMVTNGSDNSTQWDWCLFAEPYLHVKPMRSM